MAILRLDDEPPPSCDVFLRLGVGGASIDDRLVETVLGASSSLAAATPPPSPARAEKDVEVTMAPREVTRFRTVETPAAASASPDSSSSSCSPFLNDDFLEGLFPRRLSSFPLVPSLGRAFRYGGMIGVLESSR